MDAVTIKLGKRIRELREERGISQEKLALLAELDRTYISSVERGRRNISIINIEKITTSLNCDLASFFDSDIFRNEEIN